MLKKPGLEELVRELEKDYARWEQVYMAGSKDPFWPDGVNANLCRNHILCGKKRIRELYPDAEMPEIYYRPLPQELPAEYMARKEELRSAALRSYTRYISDENFCFIRNHVERIPETDALRGILDALLARADCCFAKRMRKLFRKNEKSVLRFCNKSSKTKRAFTKVLMPCKRPF